MLKKLQSWNIMEYHGPWDTWCRYLMGIPAGKNKSGELNGGFLPWENCLNAAFSIACLIAGG